MKFLKKIIFFITLSILSYGVNAQLLYKSENLKIFDSIILDRNIRVDTIWIAYDFSDSGGTSVIIYRDGDEKKCYRNVLACYRCKEKNAPGYTYGGYRKNGNILGFAQIDFLHIDTVYIDFSSKEPVIKKIVIRSYDRDIASYQYVPINKMTIKKYSSISLTNDTKSYFNIHRIKWKSTLSGNISEYQYDSKWLSNYLITDTINLAKNEQIYIGFDYRDGVSIILYSRNNMVEVYRNILFENSDSIEKRAKNIGVKAIKRERKIIVFIQKYSQNIDSIYINFAKVPPVYYRIAHISSNNNVLILPKIDVPINKARTLFGNLFIYPKKLKNKWFLFEHMIK